MQNVKRLSDSDLLSQASSLVQEERRITLELLHTLHEIERERRSASEAERQTLARFGGFWKMARKFWYTGMGEMYRSFSKRAFWHALQGLMPEVKFGDLVSAGAGVRAQAVEPSGKLVDDFFIRQAERMIHVLNAPSPAATASIAIGRTIADMALKELGLPPLGPVTSLLQRSHG